MTISQQLVHAHRLAQLQLGQEIIDELHGIWTTLDPRNLDATVQAWLEAVRPIVTAGRAASSELSAMFLDVLRQLELPDVQPLTPSAALPLPVEQLDTSMLVTGPYSIKRNTAAGLDLTKASNIALGASAAAAMRHALNGGRETIRATGARDPHLRGYARVTSGSACPFCAGIAAEGIVYVSESSGAFLCHDGCSCSDEPIYEAA